MPAYLRDNVKARILCADGTHYRARRAPDEPRHRCQEELLYGRMGGMPLVAESLGHSDAEPLAETVIRKPAAARTRVANVDV